MSDQTLDELANSARYRGLKLVRSRVRTKGNPGYGKVGLTDAKGKSVFGMGDGPSASPEDVAGYLRSAGVQDWGASLDMAVAQRKKAPRKSAPKPAKRLKPPKPKPEPVPSIRTAKPGDAPSLAALIRTLDHAIDEKAVRKNVTQLVRLGEAPLVAMLGKDVVGLCAVHRMTTVHRDAPVGRITILVVAKHAQRKGIGRRLVEEAGTFLRKAGCKIVEVTSNDRLGPAHSFYRHIGFERTSIRFVKEL